MAQSLLDACEVRYREDLIVLEYETALDSLHRLIVSRLCTASRIEIFITSVKMRTYCLAAFSCPTAHHRPDEKRTANREN